tara:strand:- start:604 stop:2103 length:1500 start_codon:yes stop_codon:yes gene_type:complete
MKVFGILNFSVVIIYFSILLCIGYLFSKRQKTTEDYFKGQGRVPWWASGVSIFGTLLSAITFMAIPAKAYATDWSYFLYSLTVILLTPLITLIFIPLYSNLKITSVYEYLEKRFNLITRILGSIAFIIFQIGRIAVVLLLPSIAITTVTGIDIMLCILTIGLISIIYTLMGGIEAVIWTDVIQVFVLLGGALITILVICLSVNGGLTEIIQIASSDKKFNVFNFNLSFSEPSFWVVIIGGIGANIISYGTDQTVVQRYMTSNKLKDSNKTFYLNVAAILPTQIIFFALGTCLYVFYKLNPNNISNLEINYDAILPWFIINELPAGLSGLLIAGILSAAMSSLSSSINSSATTYVTDIHKKLRPGMLEHNLLITARVASLVIGVSGTLLAAWMALSDIKSLWDEFIKILGLFAGGLGGLFLLGMTTKRPSGHAAIFGLIFSGFTQFIIVNNTDIHSLLYAATGIISCFVFGYLSSFFFPKKKQNISGLTISKTKKLKKSF